jgi:hypothetical protein
MGAWLAIWMAWGGLEVAEKLARQAGIVALQLEPIDDPALARDVALAAREMLLGLLEPDLPCVR